jgi:preprotein translocase subunit SecG
MTLTQILLMVAVMAVAILLIGAVLIQNAKGGGIASNIGVSNQLFGARRETELIEKWTWRLVAILGILCILSGFFYERNTTDETTGYTPISSRMEE